MSKRFNIADKCTWINYVRVHDDIGWTFADEEAAELGVNGYDHRRFLNSFYNGEFEGSFAKGLPFGYNAKTGDMRISGTAASLAGLEHGVEQNDEYLIDLALRRLHLIHSVILSSGGIPLIYLGDELATLNDYSFQDEPKKQVDSRWAHRQKHDWEAAELRHDAQTIQGRMYLGLKHMIAVRKATPPLGSGATTFFSTQNEHVLAYIRSHSILCLCNFSEHEQLVSCAVIAAYASLDDIVYDLLTETEIEIGHELVLEPYQVLWLRYDA
jgi:amylosucrase